MPFHIEAARHWTTRSWDRTQVPKPFSRMALVIGEPMFVPPDADDAAIESRRVALERALQLLESRALALLGKSL